MPGADLFEARMPDRNTFAARVIVALAALSSLAYGLLVYHLMRMG